uniref:Uncharacterized protein n=1 Tax=Strix occidentalis caurina TaxID=311401 RepID=A0A8D0FE78_STROC
MPLSSALGEGRAWLRGGSEELLCPGVIPSPPLFSSLLQTWTLHRGIFCALCIRGCSW